MPLRLPPEAVTGVERIDAQHAAFFEQLTLFNAATLEQRAAPSYLRAYADALLDSLVTHFRDEEEIMVEHGYPALSSHIAAHFTIWRSGISLIEDCEKDGWGPISVSRIAALLDAVLGHHIVDHDVHVAHYLRWKTAGAVGPAPTLPPELLIGRTNRP
jgi:hemerythrin-like metal-binding protein